MRILITGGAGFIGSNLVRQILNGTDHQIVNLDVLTYAGNLASLEDLKLHPHYCFEQADLCDYEAVRAVFTKYHPEAVMHLAAESHVDRSIDGPGAFIQTNVIGTFNLLQAALEYWKMLANEARERFRFLHVSTDEVYGSLGPHDPPFTERTAYDPHSPYSASKAASDHFARAWGDTYGLPVLVTNCSNNYGPYQFPEKLIPVVILKCLKREPIPVYGKGENIRDWLFVEDHCRALLTVLERGTPGNTYNIGGDNEMRNIDIVTLICRMVDQTRTGSASTEGVGNAFESESLIKFVADRPGHDMRYAIDFSRIKSDLGWSPSESAKTGFRKTVQWYLDNESWWQSILNRDYKLERLGIGSTIVGNKYFPKEIPIIR